MCTKTVWTSSFERQNGLIGPVATQHCHNIWWRRPGYRHIEPTLQTSTPCYKAVTHWANSKIPELYYIRILPYVTSHLMAPDSTNLTAASKVHPHRVCRRDIGIILKLLRQACIYRTRKEQPTNKKPPIHNSGCGIYMIFKSHMSSYETYLILGEEHN